MRVDRWLGSGGDCGDQERASASEEPLTVATQSIGI